MAEFLTCFACDREPTQQCPRCGRPYCDEHGEELCDVCLQPTTGVPSAFLYRGSLAVLLVGTLLAVWFLVQPGGKTSGSGLVAALQTPTAAPAARQTPAAGVTQVPGTVVTPSASAPAGVITPLTTAAAGTTPGTATTGTPRPAGTTTPSAGGSATPASGSASTYTVVSGDTLGAICSAQRPSLANATCVDSLRSLNNLSGDNISIGQSLKLP